MHHLKRALRLFDLCYGSFFYAIWTSVAFGLFPIVSIITNLQVFHEVSLASAAAHKPFPVARMVAAWGLTAVILAVAVLFGSYGVRQLRLLRSAWREFLSVREEG